VTKRETAIVASALVALSALVYATNYLLFHNAHDLFFYLLIDLGFLPLSVLFLTLVVDRLLKQRAAQARRHKMNMVIGAFFSAVGTDLLRLMGRFVEEAAELGRRLAIDPTWTEAQIRAAAEVAQLHCSMRGQTEEMAELRDYLATHREFMMRLLENPILLEHESFTDLLWATFHLEEELSARRDLAACSKADQAHLAGDLERAYTRLVAQWLQYMEHLRRAYPFLFSFAARTNPLRPGAHAELE
jgi:hypothetical protein